MNPAKMKNLIPDLPSGNLDNYRERATFDWKLLKLNLEGEAYIEFQNRLWNFIKRTPIFEKSEGITLDEMRRLCTARTKALKDNDIIDPFVDGGWCNVICQYDPSIQVKDGIVHGMVPNTILTLGSAVHADILNHINTGYYKGCFALTEVAHGTNVKGMRTTATYDVDSKSFILNSADFEAAKCWAGGLGKTATHAVTYAQLITPDGQNHGLHNFIVPIRDPETYLPYPGVIVGDMGEKIGLNGVDNGFVMFKNYRIPRTYFLNRTGDVTEDGKYVMTVKNEKERYGIALGTLSSGRAMITSICMNYASLAMVIAIRYCAVRKQFGPSESVEWPVIEYQAQQWRLLPHLAATYAMKIFSGKFIQHMREFHLSILMQQTDDRLSQLGIEIHALSSAAKPLCSWTSRDIIQNCRESCGGHGYLKMARLGDLRADNDANCTYEGENNVLIQQASNWLLNQWSDMMNGKPVRYPLGSADFITDANHILKQKFLCTTVQQTLEPENLLVMFKWLICHYLKKTYEHVHSLKTKGESDFEAKNNSQVFLAQTLSLLYAEHAIMMYFIECLQDQSWRMEEHRVLKKLCSLYGAVAMEKRLGDLYAGGYASSTSGADTLIRDGILMLCKELVPEVIALVDVLAPPDFIVNSPLGMSDGKVYEHMKEWFFKNKENLERPSWWKELTVQSKL